MVHGHPWADSLPALGAALDRFLDRVATGGDARPDRLRYVGLGIRD